MLRQIIKTSSSYSVCIGKGLLPQLGTALLSELPDIKEKKVVIISDENVMPLYGNTVANTLTASGCNTLTYSIPAGETSKNWSLLGELLEFLAESEITRSDYLLALGGGVVGDLTGFAASVFLRGISFIQVPTTLLAAVDSSVGGKTAVDLIAGKNLAGTFWQPKAVFCDVDTLSTLPKHVFLDGLAESIKYGLLRDESLFQDILNNGLESNREGIIARCIAMKGDIVAEDEFDMGTRELLNLGHTFGHAIETCSSYGISHGHAVAIGMDMAGKAALKLGLCSPSCASRITSALNMLGFSLEHPFLPAALHHAMLKDKKRRGKTIDLILPRDIGDCCIHPIPVDELMTVLSI